MYVRAALSFVNVSCKTNALQTETIQRSRIQASSDPAASRRYTYTGTRASNTVSPTAEHKLPSQTRIALNGWGPEWPINSETRKEVPITCLAERILNPLSRYSTPLRKKQSDASKYTRRSTQNLRSALRRCITEDNDSVDSLY